MRIREDGLYPVKLGGRWYIARWYGEDEIDGCVEVWASEDWQWNTGNTPSVLHNDEDLEVIGNFIEQASPPKPELEKGFYYAIREGEKVIAEWDGNNWWSRADILCKADFDSIGDKIDMSSPLDILFDKPIPLCLICGKKLDFYSHDGEKNDQVDDAGNVEIRFHFGSKHDMCMISLDEPHRAYMCDDCFGSDEIQKRLKGKEVCSLVGKC